MIFVTTLEKLWVSDFGKMYTDRNPMSADDEDVVFVKTYGAPRSTFNTVFFREIRHDAKILEVGCNVGTQLMLLQEMGFKHLYGIDVQRYAVEKSRALVHDLDIIVGSAHDLPFKDGYFDLVMTSGLLIHINSKELPKVMGEIYRCSNRYIFGYEYYGDDGFEGITYRNREEVLWKGNYRSRYCEVFSALKTVKTMMLPRVDGNGADQLFLLEKQGGEGDD